MSDLQKLGSFVLCLIATVLPFAMHTVGASYGTASGAMMGLSIGCLASLALFWFVVFQVPNRDVHQTMAVSLAGAVGPLISEITVGSREFETLRTVNFLLLIVLVISIVWAFSASDHETLL
ncbi:hypothetical protein [Schlesneria sp. DSM 10557]|uniref:hypothetical protein n=1 Tax=Schlesneria sp. DSM 10557 TaxID=3044399 RepID=UPI0035A01589